MPLHSARTTTTQEATSTSTILQTGFPRFSKVNSGLWPMTCLQREENTFLSLVVARKQRGGGALEERETEREKERERRERN